MEHNQPHPWLNARWAASQHGFDPAIAVPARPVILHDLTIRDGEECADLAFTTEDKIRIAEALARLGIRRTEIFLTVPGRQCRDGIGDHGAGSAVWRGYRPAA